MHFTLDAVRQFPSIMYPIINERIVNYNIYSKLIIKLNRPFCRTLKFKLIFYFITNTILQISNWINNSQHVRQSLANYLKNTKQFFLDFVLSTLSIRSYFHRRFSPTQKKKRGKKKDIANYEHQKLHQKLHTV